MANEKKKEYDRKYYLAHRAQDAARCRKYRQAHKEETRNSVLKYRNSPKGLAMLQRIKDKNKNEFSHKRAARNALKYAVRKGVLIRKPCEVCGNVKSEGHHEDYSKPLEVRWLCSIHHHEIHHSISPGLTS